MGTHVIDMGTHVIDTGTRVNDMGTHVNDMGTHTMDIYVADVWLGFKIFIKIWIFDLLLGSPWVAPGWPA